MLKNGALFALLVFVVGCRATFPYDAPPQRLKATGPSIAVLPVVDKRADTSLDKALKKDAAVKMQQAIADELRSMNRFSAVRAVSEFDPQSDLVLQTELHELEWVLPDRDRMMMEAAAVGAMGGAIGGAIYLSTSTDVNGHCKIDVFVETTGESKRKFRRTYLGAASEARSKGSSDSATTKARIASLAFKNALKKMKYDLDDQVGGYTGHIKR